MSMIEVSRKVWKVGNAAAGNAKAGAKYNQIELNSRSDGVKKIGGVRLVKPISRTSNSELRLLMHSASVRRGARLGVMYILHFQTLGGKFLLL